MITAVLINYKRDRELKEIVKHLESIKDINEILVWDNTKDNVYTWGRYLMARKAKNDTIYTQDDDCIVNNITKLIWLYDGKCLVNALQPEQDKFFTGKETLVGWGALFDKSWITVFDKWLGKYGEDYLLYRGADRIFTTLLGTHKTIPAEIKNFPSAFSKEMALYHRPDFFTVVDQVRERLNALA